MASTASPGTAGPSCRTKAPTSPKASTGSISQAVIAYARQKGVRLRLWMHWQAAKQHMARAFPLYRAWGIEGVMIDFMDRDDQEMVVFQRELLQLAADNHLTVTLHGVAAPTGLERTFPNLLTSEAVLNLEYNKWDDAGVTPEHDVTVPLTRMLAGPLDYHQGSLARRAARAVQAASRRAAGDRHARADAGLVRRAPEPPADDGRLSVGLSPASARRRPRRGARHLGRHEGACPPASARKS